MSFGIEALLSLVVHLFFLVVTWFALQSLRVDLFVKDPSSGRAKVLLILLTVAIGSLVGDFFMTYFSDSVQLHYLF